MNNFRKTVLATSMAVGLVAAGSVSAAFTSGPFLFDRNGATGGSDPLSVNSLNWNPNTVLDKGIWTTTTTNPAGPVGATSTQSPNNFILFSQGSLGSLSTNNDASPPDCSAPGLCSPRSGTEITFQFQVPMVVTSSTSAAATGNPDRLVTSIDAANTTTPAIFKIWYDAGPDAGTAAAILAGTGFGDNMAVTSCPAAGPFDGPAPAGRLILCGTILGATHNFTAASTPADPTIPLEPPYQRLDGSGGDDYGTIGTETGLGSYDLLIHVDYQDTAFFKTILTTLVIGANQNGANNLQFSQVSPSALVSGSSWNVGSDTGAMVSPPGGSRFINNLNCRNNTAGEGQSITQTCDMVFQGQPTFSAAPTDMPEPGSLALLGLSMGLLGLTGRRLRRRA